MIVVSKLCSVVVLLDPPMLIDNKKFVLQPICERHSKTPNEDGGDEFGSAQRPDSFARRCEKE